MEQDIYVALDLGNSRIRMMAATRDEGGELNVLGMEEVATKAETIQNGVIKNPSEVAYMVSDIAKKLANRMNNHHTICAAYAALNGRTLRTTRGKVERAFDAPTEIGRKDLSSLRQEIYNKPVEGRSIYHISTEEYGIDGDIIHNPEGMICKHIEANYLIGYARPDLRANFDRCMDLAGFKETEPRLAPIAVADAVLTERQRQEGCAVLNFGATTTTVTVYQGGYLRHVATVPFGGQHITNDLRHLNLGQEEAEQIKCQYGSATDTGELMSKRLRLPGKAGEEERCVPGADIHNVIEARLDEIVTLCMTEVKRSGYVDRLNGGIVVTGGASRLKDFKKFMMQRTNMGVEYGDHRAHLNEASREQYGKTEYALLIGLLMGADGGCTRVEQPAAGGEETQEKKVSEPKKKKGFGGRIIDLFAGSEDGGIED